MNEVKKTNQLYSRGKGSATSNIFSTYNLPSATSTADHH
jgi:hypothetical protein